MSDVLTTAQAAHEMACHEKTVRRMIRRGELRAARVGSRYRIRREDLPTEPRPMPRPPRRRYRPSGEIGRIVESMEQVR